MTPDRPGSYRLTPKAILDLEDIWRYTAENWSIDQVDRYVGSLTGAFDTIAAMPEIARERLEFTPAVRIHVIGRHLIIYQLVTDHVVIIRILGASQDWTAILALLDA